MQKSIENPALRYIGSLHCQLWNPFSIDKIEVKDEKAHYPVTKDFSVWAGGLPKNNGHYKEKESTDKGFSIGGSWRFGKRRVKRM